MSRSDDSLAAYQEARTALESLTAESPARADYRRDLAAVLNQTAVAHEARSEFEQSANTFQAAMELLESLLASTPNEPDLKRQLASVWNNRGRLQSRQRDFAAAESSYREAVRLRSELVKANPQSAFVRELMENLNNLAVIQGRLEKHQAAVDILNEAISTFRLLPESEQHEARPRASLATAQLNLAANLGPLGDLDRAVEFNRDGISTLQSLVPRLSRGCPLPRTLRRRRNQPRQDAPQPGEVGRRAGAVRVGRATLSAPVGVAPRTSIGQGVGRSPDARHSGVARGRRRHGENLNVTAY